MPSPPSRGCGLGVSFGPESDLYSFPLPHPLNSSRTGSFKGSLSHILSESSGVGSISLVRPVKARKEDLLLFHDSEYIDLVERSSRIGEGCLDQGDTPVFRGMYEASLIPVGDSLKGLEFVLAGKFDHFFKPIGGLHHARSDRAGGFCVFNDAGVTIRKAITDNGLERVAYVDIDAHHGDGVFYAFESDPRVIIGDVHEDGRFLYPGTGSADETGAGAARGTKLNIPLPPGAGDAEFFSAMDRTAQFVRSFNPQFIFFQCGADCLDGDPITHLRYTPAAHAYAARKLHDLAHELCGGRLLAMGGGGYDPENLSAAWSAVIEELSGRRT